MRDQYAHLPEDIAAEKRLAFEFRKTYRRKAFSSLRTFRALRLEAPGVIAEYTIGGLIALGSCAAFFRDYAERNPDGSGWYALIQFIIILIVSLYAGHLVWRTLGVYVRGRIRYLVRNMWVLVGIGFLVLYLLSLLAQMATTVTSAN